MQELISLKNFDSCTKIEYKNSTYTDGDQLVNVLDEHFTKSIVKIINVVSKNDSTDMKVDDHRSNDIF